MHTGLGPLAAEDAQGQAYGPGHPIQENAEEGGLMTRLPANTKPMTTGSLINRSEQIIELYDAEDKDYAFSDSGDAESYAAEMADILEKWAKSYRASRNRYPSTDEE
jgi:hypothetical protein